MHFTKHSSRQMLHSGKNLIRIADPKVVLRKIGTLVVLQLLLLLSKTGFLLLMLVTVEQSCVVLGIHML